MSSTTKPTLPLSEREKDVLGLVALGNSAKMTARELGIEEDTVKSYIKRIRAKYESAGRTAGNSVLLTHRAIEDGFLIVHSRPSADESSTMPRGGDEL